MKKFNYLLTSVMLLILGSSVVKAQNAENPWLISIGMHAVDHTSVRGLGTGFFDVDDYSIVPPLSKLTIARALGDGPFAVDLTASIGEIDNNRLLIQDEFFINAGLGLRYHILQNHWFNPYLRIGANYHLYDYEGLDFTNGVAVEPGTGGENNVLEEVVTGEKNHFGLAGGLGINFWVTKNFGINVASDYNWLPESSTDYFDFFQHSVGVNFRFGGDNDRDDDGIIDDEDDCPDTFGVASTVEGCNGCPDQDGDGLCDGKDNCPTEAGPIDNQGCPIIVPEGPCGPNTKDSDGDGICDKDDDCPNIKGAASSKPGCNGCPDSDGDGICDDQDPCPGDPKNECELLPELEKIKNVLFEYNSEVVIPESQTALKGAANILSNDAYSHLYWLVEGHTDSKGSASYNQALSQRRADAIKKYLVDNGVAASHVKAIGLGEAYPVRPNDTERGRQANRRVEFEPTDSNFNPTALTVDDELAARVINKLSKKVYFQTGSSKLLETSELNLDRIAEYLKQSGKNWEVGGHTDNVGSDENNLKLSQDRAQSVVDYLVSKGVSSSKLTAKGYGESSPVDSNDTKDGRANNRRIEFK